MDYLIKLFIIIVTIFVGICLVACPIVFGYIHNYQAMWATLILGGIGFWILVMLPEMIEADEKIPTTNDFSGINLDKEGTQIFLKEFLARLNQAAKELNKKSKDKL